MRHLDVRTLEPFRRHASIYDHLDQLEVGDTLRIVVDHDPRPLRYELDDRLPDAFTWTYVECGPDRWTVDLSRKQASSSSSVLVMDLLADCPSLLVGSVRLPAGSSRRFEGQSESMALIVRKGKGSISILGSRRDVTEGTVEMLCPSDSCTISATTELQIYVIVTKKRRAG